MEKITYKIKMLTYRFYEMNARHFFKKTLEIFVLLLQVSKVRLKMTLNTNLKTYKIGLLLEISAINSLET